MDVGGGGARVFYNATILLQPPRAPAAGGPPGAEAAAASAAAAANWWALSACGLAVGTAAGNILVCLAICWERRLQNVTNYFLMSLAITDLMVAVLVMPLGILTLVRGYFPLPSIYCLAWICLDVLFCTASIMHLCTISVDRYLSLRYPMKFGRNKSRRRVTLKIVFVWLLSIAMSLPLSLMYSKDQGSLIIEGTCQIPDPLYKFIGSIICFYIPLLVMLVTYALTVRLLANQKQSLGTPNWSSNWMGSASTPLERRCTWRKLLGATTRPPGGKQSAQQLPATPQHAHSAGSTDTELTALDTHELWLQEPEPAPCAVSALGAFGAEMLKLSRGLQEAAAAAAVAAAAAASPSPARGGRRDGGALDADSAGGRSSDSLAGSRSSLLAASAEEGPTVTGPRPLRRRRASTFHEGDGRDDLPAPRWRRRGSSLRERRASADGDGDDGGGPLEASESAPFPLPPPCTCPYFGGGGEAGGRRPPPPPPAAVRIVPGAALLRPPADASPKRGALARGGRASGDTSPAGGVVVTWEARRSHRRGSSFGSARSSLLAPSGQQQQQQRTPLPLRRSATLRQNGHGAGAGLADKNRNPSSPCLLQRYAFSNASGAGGGRAVRPHHSRNSSVISRNSSRHGRIIRLEQKATKVLGVVFFTFVILWAPFFILNLLPAFCLECDKNLAHWVIPLVTWLGYASSMVNPIFYTIFNKVFRQAFKKVLTCKYRKTAWRPHR